MNFTFDVINNIREIFKKILEDNTLEELNRVPKGFNNNIIWNIGHIVVSEQLLAYKLSGLPANVSNELIDKYKKGSKPQEAVTKEGIEEIKALLFSTIRKTNEDYNAGVFKNYNAYTVSTTGNTLTNIDEALEFIMIHEGIHYGYILALLKAVKI